MSSVENFIFPESSIRFFFADDNVIHFGNNGMMTKDYDVHECLSNKYYDRSNEGKYRVKIKRNKKYKLNGKLVMIIDLENALNELIKGRLIIDE